MGSIIFQTYSNFLGEIIILGILELQIYPLEVKDLEMKIKGKNYISQDPDNMNLRIIKMETTSYHNGKMQALEDLVQLQECIYSYKKIHLDQGPIDLQVILAILILIFPLGLNNHLDLQ